MEGSVTAARQGPNQKRETGAMLAFQSLEPVVTSSRGRVRQMARGQGRDGARLDQLKLVATEKGRVRFQAIRGPSGHRKQSGKPSHRIGAVQLKEITGRHRQRLSPD